MIAKSRSKSPISAITWLGIIRWLIQYLSSNALSDFVRSEDGKKAQMKIWKELEEKLEAIEPGIMGQV